MHPKKKIISFVLLSSIGIVIMMFVNDMKNEGSLAKETFWTEKTHNDTKYEVVIYGDSRTYKGVDPEKMGAGSEFSMYNFGYSSGSMSSRMLEFIESKLDKTGARPIIVLGISPYEFTVNARKDEHFLQERERSKSQILQRKYQSDLFKYFTPITPSEVVGLKHNIEVYKEGGFVKMTHVKFDTLKGLESYRKNLMDNPLVEDAFEVVFDFVKKMSKSGVEVYGFRVPCMISMQRLEDEISGFSESNFSAGFVKNGGKWIEMDTREFTTYDGSHLTVESGNKLADKLREEIFGD